MKGRMALVGLVMLGCSSADPDSRADTSGTSGNPVTPAAVPEPPFDSASVAGLTCLTLMDAVFRAPLTRGELIQAYGAPDSMHTSTEPNRHVPGVVDSLFRVFYRGLTAGFRKPGGGSDLITQMEATDNRYLGYPSIGIGARRDRLIQVVSDTYLVTDDRVEYDCGMGANEPVTFWLVAGQIRRVSKTYYVD
jgi:hypothetical protein